MDRNRTSYNCPQSQHDNAGGRHQYYDPLPYHQPAYAHAHHTQNFVNYPTFSSSSNWAPYYVPQYEVPYLSPYDTCVWRSSEPDAASNWVDFSMTHRDNVYGGYQPGYIHGMLPHHHQHIPQAFSSYSIHIENPRRVSAARYLSFSEILNEEVNPPRHSTNLTYHLEDEVLVLYIFPPPTPYETRSATEDLHSQTAPFDEALDQRNLTYIPFHQQDDVMILDMSPPTTNYEDFHSPPAPANVDISDETIEKYLNKKTYVSSTNLSKKASRLDDDFDICVVCQAEYVNKEEICALRCGHGYHVDCIKTWLRKKNECPMCRAAVLELEHSKN